MNTYAIRHNLYIFLHQLYQNYFEHQHNWTSGQIQTAQSINSKSWETFDVMCLNTSLSPL